MSELDRLAELLGIQRTYVDAHGKTVRASEATLRRLIAAMGLKATDARQVSTTLDALERRIWERALPAVVVGRSGDTSLAVDLVASAETGEIQWKLALEDGSTRRGRIAFDRLDRLRAHRLDDRLLECRRLPLGVAFDSDRRSGSSAELPLGYHQLSISPGGGRCTVIITPHRCWLPEESAGGLRLWGIAAQLYLQRSATDWGIGDFSTLNALATLATANGADVIGLNPLHALFHDDPAHTSPYSPASRLLLSPLYIDVLAVPELRTCAQAHSMIDAASFQQQVEQCRSRDLLDYAAIAQLKLPVLRILFDACRDAPDPSRWQAFQAFVAERGEVFARHCRFLALREQQRNEHGAAADWQAWPEALRDPDSAAVSRFAEERRDAVDFQAWLQWVADSQLAAAMPRDVTAANATSANETPGIATPVTAKPMAIGLYRDLAVGAAPSGAETWANPRVVVAQAQVGAPPDIHNVAGQDWGLPPFSPHGLREEGYRSFIELVRSNMRHAGALRIDHVMGLQQLYWIPAGATPAEGAFVRYPLEDLVGILALESERAQCLVVGEDLGTVPAGFREAMAAANILSYRVLFFEKSAERFLPSADYPALALGVTGSHDLPTLPAWWAGSDLDLKVRLGLFPKADVADSHRAMRAAERLGLTALLRNEGLLAADTEIDAASLVPAAHRFLARSPALLVMAQMDDLLGEVEPVNVPTTRDEYPNWRRRHAIAIEELEQQPGFQETVRAIRAERGVR